MHRPVHFSSVFLDCGRAWLREKIFIVSPDKKLTAVVELERAIHQLAVDLIW
jgi:hypothetical protein